MNICICLSFDISSYFFFCYCCCSGATNTVYKNQLLIILYLIKCWHWFFFHSLIQSIHAKINKLINTIDSIEYWFYVSKAFPIQFRPIMKDLWSTTAIEICYFFNLDMQNGHFSQLENLTNIQTLCRCRSYSPPQSKSSAKFISFQKLQFNAVARFDAVCSPNSIRQQNQI